MCCLRLWSWQPLLSSQSRGGGPQIACWGSPDHDLQRAGTTDDTSDCCDRFATSNHIFGLHVAASTVGGQGVGPPAAISTLEFGKQEIDGHPYTVYRYHLVLPPSPQNYHTHLQLTCTHTVPIGVQSPVVVSEGTHFLHLEYGFHLPSPME